MNNILVLCIGNICRSPVAEAMSIQQFPEKKVWSAWLAALAGYPADDKMITMSTSVGLDLFRHRAQQVLSLMCQTADIILVMEHIHKFELEKKWPMVRG